MGMTKEQLQQEIEKLNTNPDLQTKIEKNLSKYEDYSSRGKVGLASGTFRAVSQGVSLGFGDEIEAAFDSIGSDKSYEENLKAVRNKIESFKRTNPTLAYGGEIVGSIATSLTGAGTFGKAVQLGTKAVTGGKIANVGKVGTSLGTGAIEGGIYGAGSAEENRLAGAGMGATIGGGMAGAFSAVLPRSSEAAKKLLDKKIPLTVGQEFTEGPGGRQLSGLEQSLTSYPGVGGAISSAREKAVDKFNKVVMSEALDPILTKNELNDFLFRIRNKSGNEAFDEMKTVISTKYTDVLDNMSLPEEGITALQNEFTDSITKQFKGIIDPTSAKKATSIFNKELNQVVSIVDNKMIIDGKRLKTFETTLRNKAKQFYKSGGSEAEIGTVFDNSLDAFRNLINQYNDSNQLKNINKAYAAYIPIKLAVTKANKTKGVFSTSQFLNAIKDADQSIGKINTAKGKNIFNDLPEIGQEVLGKTIPDSGTASRIAGGSMIGSNVLQDLKNSYGASIIADILYSRPGQTLVKGAIKGTGGLTQGISPYTASGVSGVLTQPKPEETEEDYLKSLLSP